MEKPPKYYESPEYIYFHEVSLKKTEVTTSLSKTMITISSASLIFTATFIKDILSGGKEMLFLIYFCWGLLIISIAFSVLRLLLVDIFMSNWADNRLFIARKNIDTRSKSPKLNALSSLSKYLSVALFLISLILFTLFIIINL